MPMSCKAKKTPVNQSLSSDIHVLLLPESKMQFPARAKRYYALHSFVLLLHLFLARSCSSATKLKQDVLTLLHLQAKRAYNKSAAPSTPTAASALPAMAVGAAAAPSEAADPEALVELGSTEAAATRMP